ncbi:MAG: hypothetical protein NT154_11640 [Verrucomicrobia bacterium]|nr:hypothetical protein [Verrucomicrobiota bacterium]
MLPSKEDDLFGSPSKSKSNDEVATQDDSKLPSGLRESAEKLNKQFQPNGGDNPFLQAEAHGNLMDTFGLDMKPPTKEQVQEHKKYMDGYRSVVERSWRPPEAPTPGNPLATIADSATPAWKPTTGLPSSPSLAPSKRFGAPSDMVSPSLGPTALPDVNLQALGQTKSMAVLPKMDSPRVAPVAPTFTAPTRSFR